jgi:hypothetical protein
MTVSRNEKLAYWSGRISRPESCNIRYSCFRPTSNRVAALCLRLLGAQMPKLPLSPSFCQVPPNCASLRRGASLSERTSRSRRRASRVRYGAAAARRRSYGGPASSPGTFSGAISRCSHAQLPLHERRTGAISPSDGSLQQAAGSCVISSHLATSPREKAYLSSVVDAISFRKINIRIFGSNGNIRSTFGPNGQPVPRVRKSVQEWRPGPESNHRHQHSSPLC